MPKSEWMNKKTTLIILLLKSCFFKRILFCYVTGNEDMHLKNFLPKMEKTTLAIYDFLNSTIALKSKAAEITFKGKK
jgi:serine/threonine-protein kinase HipA